MRGMLADLLTEMFGPLPAWASQRLQSASAAELQSWARSVLYAARLEDALR
jgi:hypothetical protein